MNELLERLKEARSCIAQHLSDIAKADMIFTQYQSYRKQLIWINSGIVGIGIILFLYLNRLNFYGLLLIAVAFAMWKMKPSIETRISQLKEEIVPVDEQISSFNDHYGSVIAFIPSEYLFLEYIDEMIRFVETGRCDTMKEVLLELDRRIAQQEQTQLLRETREAVQNTQNSLQDIKASVSSINASVSSIDASAKGILGTNMTIANNSYLLAKRFYIAKLDLFDVHPTKYK